MVFRNEKGGIREEKSDPVRCADGENGSWENERDTDPEVILPGSLSVESWFLMQRLTMMTELTCACRFFRYC